MTSVFGNDLMECLREGYTGLLGNYLFPRQTKSVQCRTTVSASVWISVDRSMACQTVLVVPARAFSTSTQLRSPSAKEHLLLWFNYTLHSERETLTRCWFIVGPPSHLGNRLVFYWWNNTFFSTLFTPLPLAGWFSNNNVLSYIIGLFNMFIKTPAFPPLSLTIRHRFIINTEGRACRSLVEHQ